MKRSSPTSPLDTEQLVYTAARSMGWIVPTTEDEVRATEDIPLDDIPLPDALKNPLATLDEEVARAHRKRRHLPVPASETFEALARAARDGTGDISPEAEATMKRDRDAAESVLSSTKKE